MKNDLKMINIEKIKRYVLMRIRKIKFLYKTLKILFSIWTSLKTYLSIKYLNYKVLIKIKAEELSFKHFNKVKNIEDRNFFISHIIKSFENAIKGKSKLNDLILNMKGMSGVMTRHFYNNICSFARCRYLEIGTWSGSTLCSALYKNNNATAVAIDNWSAYGGPKQEALSNIRKYGIERKVKFIEEDCFKVDNSKLGKFNVYLYDGSHDEISHYNAIKYFYKNLEDICIIIIDDWNWKAVRDGTKRAFQELNVNIIYEKEIRLTGDNQHTHIHYPGPFQGKQPNLAELTWWNGIYVCLIDKRL